MFLWFLTPVQAEIKTFVHTVRQPFSGSQSPDDARASATHKAKREVLEKTGTYLETLTIVEKGKLTKEQILVLASGVLKIEIISQKNYHTEEGFGIVIKARVKVDTSLLGERVKKFMADRRAMEQLTAVRKREKELLVKIERLEEVNRRLGKKRATQTVKKKKRELRKDFQQTTKGLDAVALNEQVLDLWKDGKYENPRKVIGILNRAIKLDPDYADAYNNLGFSYDKLKQYDRAIQNYDKAIELNPHFAVLYSNRGVTYNKLNQYMKAIQDHDKSIELDPSYARAYGNRGNVYVDLKQYNKAIQDYDKAIELNPNLVGVYFNRGGVYIKLKQYNGAIQNYDKVIELDPDHAVAYNNRAVAYGILENISQACADLKKACDLGYCKGWKIARKEGGCY